MSLQTQEAFRVPEPNFNPEAAKRYSQMLNFGATQVSTQPSIKKEYTQSSPNAIPFFRTDDAKGGFNAQQRNPFSPDLLDQVEGRLFIERHRLIDRRLNPFLSHGDLLADTIARQV